MNISYTKSLRLKWHKYKASYWKCIENKYHSNCTNSISQKKPCFFIWVIKLLCIICLNFFLITCPHPILTLHLFLNYLDGLWKSRIQWSSCPGSNGNLSLECLWAGIVLKMVNLKPPNRECTFCINWRCCNKDLERTQIKSIELTWCRAKVKPHLWHTRTMLSGPIPILHNPSSLFNSRGLDDWVSQICNDCVGILRIVRFLWNHPLWLGLKSNYCYLYSELQ